MRLRSVQGVQGSASGVTVPATLGADSLNAAAVKVMVYFGLDPTKVDLSIIPERLRITDVGTGKRLDGTEQQLNYGAVLIAIAKLAPTGVSVSEFSQIVAAEIKAGVAGSSSNLLKGFADNYFGHGQKYRGTRHANEDPSPPVAWGVPVGLGGMGFGDLVLKTRSDHASFQNLCRFIRRGDHFFVGAGGTRDRTENLHPGNADQGRRNERQLQGRRRLGQRQRQRH
jgi:hypothetical protein